MAAALNVAVAGCPGVIDSPGSLPTSVPGSAVSRSPANAEDIAISVRAINSSSSSSSSSLEPPIAMRLPESPGSSLRLQHLTEAVDNQMWTQQEARRRRSFESQTTDAGTPMSPESDDSRSTLSAASDDVAGDIRAAETFVETDRTSVCSSDDWADCEYELQAGKHVAALFEQIDSALYRPDSPGVDQSLPDSTLAECSEWRGAFRHLRLRGSQAVDVGELGYRILPQHDTTPRMMPQHDTTPRIQETHATEVERNSISSCLTIQPVVIQTAVSADNEAVEELLAADGCVEETIAVDDRAGSPDGGQSGRRRRFSGRAGASRGLPPLTPSLAVRDSVLDAAFDCAWQAVSASVRPLLLEHLRRQRQRESAAAGAPAAAKEDEEEDEEEEEDTRSQATHSGMTRLGRLPGQWPTGSGSAVGRRDLQRDAIDIGNCLSIRSKMLQQRDARHAAVSPVLRDIPESPGPPPPAPPPPPPPPAPPAFSRVGSGRRLQRLAPVESRARTPATVEEDAEYGGAGGGLLALQVIPLQLPSPYASFIRSGTLPPLQDRRQHQHQHQHRPGHHNRPSSGRPGAQSSLDLQMNRHAFRRLPLDVHGRSLAAADADAACDPPAPYRAYQLQLGQATNSFYRRPRQSQANIRR